MDSRLAAELEVGAVAEEEFVERAYRLLLRRDPEPAARERDLVKLREGTLSRATLLAELAGAGEFARVRALDDAIAFAAWARAAGERPRGLSAPVGDERPIEIPWCLSRYRAPERLLDAGYAFAEPAYLAALTRLGAARVVGVDLAEAAVPGIESTVADLRRLPFADGEFDIAVCISDARAHRPGQPRLRARRRGGPDGPLAALNELAASPAGSCVVPTGEREELDWLLQLPPDEWLALFERAGFLVFEHEVYALGADGWRSQPDFDPAGVRFAGDHAGAVLCAELHPGTLGRRAREAVRRLRS